MPENRPPDSEFDDTPIPGVPTEPREPSPRQRAQARARMQAMGAGGRRPGKKKIRQGDVFFFIIFAAFLGLLVWQGPKGTLQFITGLFLNRYFVLVLTTAIVVWLFAKSTDRTRVYRLENKGLRDRRRLDQAIMKRSRELLLQRVDKPILDSNADRERWDDEAQKLSDEIKDLI